MDRIAAALGIDLTDPKTQAFLAMHRERHQLIEELVAIRHDRGLRQKDVAEALGISRVAVSRMEREDRDPRLSTVMRYAEAVDAVLVLKAEKVEESPVYREFYAKREFSTISTKSVHDAWHSSSGLVTEEPKKQNRTDFVMAA